MRKRVYTAAAFLALSLVLVWASAAGGDSADPLASLSYLQGEFASALEDQIEERLDESDRALQAAAPSQSGQHQSYAAVWTEQTLKDGDCLSGSTGFGILPLSGDVRADFAGTAVVDVTDGTALSSGSPLTAGHRYLVAEDTAAAFFVTSPTAVVEAQGSYTLAPSASADYFAMARALHSLGLFRGTGTAYGQGFDLEKTPTRIQALIMFLRVLGEENAALAWSGSLPFADLVPGSDYGKYVGYAYERGYTNGVSDTAWSPDLPVNADQYTEFVLRALGYSSTATTDLTGTLLRAAGCGLLTEQEAEALSAESFLRAHLAYISCRALDTPTAFTGWRLGETLADKGVFTASQLASAQSVISSAGTLG